jgi:hypothetical protein
MVGLYRNPIPYSVARSKKWKIQASEGKRQAEGQSSIGFRRNGKGTGEDFPGPCIGKHSSGLMVLIKRAQNGSRQWLMSLVCGIGGGERIVTKPWITALNSRTEWSSCEHYRNYMALHKRLKTGSTITFTTSRSTYSWGNVRLPILKNSPCSCT